MDLSSVIEFEQLCEKLLDEQEIPEGAKIWFQVNILDSAQNIFERQQANSKGAKNGFIKL